MKYFDTIIGLIFSGMASIEIFHLLTNSQVDRVVIFGALILAILTSLELALRPWIKS